MKLKKLLPNKFWITVFFTTFVCVALSWKLFLSRDVILSFNQQSDHDVTYRVFYTTKMETAFEDKESVSYTSPAGNHNVSITISLPSKSLWRLRLMIEDTKAKEITLSNFKLSGKKTLEISDLKKFNLYHFANKKISNNSIQLSIPSNRKNNPYADFSDKFRVDTKISIDWQTFISLWVIYTIIVYKFIIFLADYKNKRGYSRIDIVLLAVFFFCLWIPMLNISDAEKSIQENRMLAKKPVFSLKKLSGYGEKFNSWYSDHLFGRAELLGLYHGIENTLTNTGNNLILKGDDNWLFWKGENSLSNFQNVSKFTDSELSNIGTYLSNIDNWAKKHGKDFYYVIAPDKNKIYGENISIIKKINPDSFGPANQIKNYLEKNTNVKVIYLYDTLLANKDKGLLYWKHDTHWSELGAYYGYLEIMRIIGQRHPNIRAVSPVSKEIVLHPIGDMVWKTDDNSQYIVPKMPNSYTCDMQSSSSGDIKCSNPKKTPRLAMFRDSYTINLLPYLASSFGKSRYLWKYKITNDDLDWIKDNADIIILENVERLGFRIIPLNFPEK